MSNRENLPTTSLEAYKAVSPEMLTNHHAKIIAALKKYGELIYEEIASKSLIEKNQVARRLSELERMQIVYKPGGKKTTTTGRLAYVYRLVENGEKSVEPERVMQGETIADYSRKLIQKTLF